MKKKKWIHLFVIGMSLTMMILVVEPVCATTISDLEKDEKTMALGCYEHKGICVHPSDFGMKCIADRIVDCIYDDAKEQNKFGYCAVNKDGKWGALKSDGTVVVEPTRDLSSYLYIDFISDWHRHSDIKLNAYTK